MKIFNKEIDKKVLFISGGALLCLLVVFLCVYLLKPSYKVSFDSKGGTAVEEQVVKSGRKAKEPKTPVKKGYEFKEWQTADGKKYSFASKVKKDISLEAVWEAKEYTLTYNTEGGEAIEPQKVKYGEKFTLEFPIKEGYEFFGWYYDSAEFNEGVWEYDKDITVDAQWIEEGSGVQATYSVRLIAERFDGSYNDVTNLYAKNYGLTGLKGSVGAVVDLRNRIKALAPPAGYIYDAEKSSLVGKIQANGLLELTVYFSYKISLPDTAEVILGEKLELELITAATLSSSDAVWSSSNKKVATVKNGVITTLSAGKTVITATYNGQTAKCTVFVYKKVAISLPKQKDTLVGGKITLKLESASAISTSEIKWTSSDTDVATVENGVVTTIAGGETKITAKYRGQTVSCNVTVYDSYIKTGEDWLKVYNDTSGYYKVVADLDTVSTASGCQYNSVFSGLIDLGGHTVKIPGSRLFNSLSGATIRNGHFVGTEAYGVWGGAIADVATKVTIENITADVTLGDTRAFSNKTDWFARSIGGLFNYVTGTITSCVVNVTIPENMTVTSGYPVNSINAIGQLGEGGLAMTGCRATLVNHYSDDTIHLLGGHSDDVIIANSPAGSDGDSSETPGGNQGGNQGETPDDNPSETPVSFSITGKKETLVGTPITLSLESASEIPASEVTWTSSNNAVATVANGVVTPVKGGTVTISAQYKGQTASGAVTIYTAYISTGTEWATVYDDLTGYYKVVADLENLSIPDTRKSETIFTGVIDFGGHTVNTPDKRLFYALKNATIRNGHLKGTSTYGIWGGILADEAINITIENIIADVAYNQTYACRNNSDWMKRNPGGLFNLITGGTITSCVVNVTITSDIAITSKYPISEISAFGRTNDGRSLTMTDCSATLVNNYNDDSIQLLFGCANNVQIPDTKTN